ncbi:hypothetical protein [Streptomyces sp. H27-H5]|uniref:hypothetical protein n=1 Tax=Streptomyces sp. H27-H5 TaxID=2996460 RepID=UPI00226FDF68|nr:hypothetical protein [Streptomyces sp. H27-H5]MCY0957672.1 hypothetical protein [Streptomyces sp. H27-H5]
MSDTYEVPALTRAEVGEQDRVQPRPAACPSCVRGTPVDHWPSPRCGSSFRRDEQGTERLFRTHCTCDGCF